MIIYSRTVLKLFIFGSLLNCYPHIEMNKITVQMQSGCPCLFLVLITMYKVPSFYFPCERNFWVAN